MRILFAGHKTRGVACLTAVRQAGHTILGVLAHAGADGPGSVAEAARAAGEKVWQPEDVNEPSVVESLAALAPDVVLLAGYGPIVKRPFIDISRRACLNLHGGRLPQYRGSSPMNWALINGEQEFGISIVRVTTGVDAGAVVNERVFPVGKDDTIADLHRVANGAFPEMVLETLQQVEAGSVIDRPQDESQSGYYPLRFPDDGIILWDLLTAEQAHNRIRALTDPYPGAFTFFAEQRVKLLASRRTEQPYYGEPGRVYRKGPQGLLVCAKDRCLWVTRLVLAESGQDATAIIKRYGKFTTVRDLAAARAAGTVWA